ncbi:hypothetical protein [Providencia rettgeri]|uniref:hypothetical protein n=1 Tax=Providencia rettgeri TaxID=587 RepID=UPI0034E0B87E
MKQIIPLITASFISLCSMTSALAGDPGPYRLVFLDISQAPYKDGQKLLIELRAMDQLPDVQNRDCFMCEGHSVEVLYVYSAPVGLLTEDLRKAVQGDKQAKIRMQTVLTDFHDKQGYGVDGLLLYEHVADKVNIYTMDKKIGSKLEIESKTVKNRLLHSSLDKLLEKAANKIDRPI